MNSHTVQLRLICVAVIYVSVTYILVDFFEVEHLIDLIGPSDGSEAVRRHILQHVQSIINKSLQKCLHHSSVPSLLNNSTHSKNSAVFTSGSYPLKHIYLEVI